MKWTKKIAYSRKVAPYIFILPFVLSFLIFKPVSDFEFTGYEFPEIKGVFLVSVGRIQKL